MITLVVLTVLEIVVLIAGLAVYLFWAGSLLNRIAANLEECSELVRSIVQHAELIGPNLEHINQTGGVVAGALPLLYGMGEQIVVGATWTRRKPRPSRNPPARRPGGAARACRRRSATPRPGRGTSSGMKICNGTRTHAIMPSAGDAHTQ
jgi:hypothetical protein